MQLVLLAVLIGLLIVFYRSCQRNRLMPLFWSIAVLIAGIALAFNFQVR